MYVLGFIDCCVTPRTLFLGGLSVDMIVGLLWFWCLIVRFLFLPVVFALCWSRVLLMVVRCFCFRLNSPFADIDTL